MKSNYTTFGSVASAELELLAKREDNGKELRCEASNPALEGTLIETTTIKIECKCCCCHLPLTCLSSCFFVGFFFLLLLPRSFLSVFLMSLASSRRLIAVSFVCVCVNVFASVYGCIGLFIVRRVLG